MQPPVDASSKSTDQATQRHPQGLYTLFFTEMWERFSYYGMRALLVLFLVDQTRGGMGLSDGAATAIYGLYTAGVYLAALPGGWLADRIFGAQKSVFYGGVIIAAGHFALAVPKSESFYLGLILVVIGTGLLKPNISAIVGELYPEGGARRDAGFTIFYMGINLGATIGPLICSTLGEKMNWHYGFGAAGIGMVLGLIQFQLTRKHLGDAGLLPGQSKPLTGLGRLALLSGTAAIILVIVLGFTGTITIDPVRLARGTTTFIVAVAAIYFGSVFLFVKLSSDEKKRIGVIVILFLSSALFWAGFEQAGSSFNLFAERYTDRMLPSISYEIPAGWFQSLGPAFIIIFAPVMAGLWVALARRSLEPSLPTKFGIALILLGFGFAILAIGAGIVVAQSKVGPSWLIITYFVHTIGELCLSPIGLSSVTKLSPRRLVGQMMGTWFLGASLGNLIAGLAAGDLDPDKISQMPGRFWQMVILPVVAGGLLIVAARWIQRLSGGIK